MSFGNDDLKTNETCLMEKDNNSPSMSFGTVTLNDGNKRFTRLSVVGTGNFRSIGVSNFDLEQLQSLVKTARILPAVNQISFNPYNYAQHKELLAFSAKHGIVTEGYSVLAPINKTPNGPVDAPVAAAAARLGITPTQVILLWARAKGVAVVTTSTSKAHLEEDYAVGDMSPLSEADIAAIDEAGAKGPPSAVLQSLRSVTAKPGTLATRIGVGAALLLGAYVTLRTLGLVCGGRMM
ncbi:NADP-dependent oxidoreductase domain-containing protein [Mycena rebaudengoi]|nr:NADP-dependent oxidoreductase domain-containing protein [Mycena rebaudengoi]